MKYGLPILLLIFSLNVLSQDQDSVILLKGRYITSLNGSIKSQNINSAFGQVSESQKITEYTIGTKSGFFIQDHWVLGLDFSLGKSASNATQFNFSSETLLLGLWSRYYFLSYYNGSLFADLTPFYSVVYQESSFNTPGYQFSEELEGKGFGLEPAIGFTYLINRNVGFGMSVSYQFGWINAVRKDLIIPVEVSEDYNFSQLKFNFSFQVYLDQFFF